jgi:hypothetical protein
MERLNVQARLNGKTGDARVGHSGDSISAAHGTCLQ